MSSDRSPKFDVIKALKEAGAAYAGRVEGGPVGLTASAQYEAFIAEGRHGEMGYLDRYHEVRNDPRLLFDPPAEECTLFPALFSYGHPSSLPKRGYPRIADYALGRDYHKVLRKKLTPIAKAIEEQFGCRARVCIDTAPLRERYWAERAGLGFVGRNGHLTVPGVGAHFFIATIVADRRIDSELPVTPATCNLQPDYCTGCTRCIDACPTGALRADGSCDASRCISYLTIESRQPIPADIPLAGNIYGCDICRLACPHSQVGTHHGASAGDDGNPGARTLHGASLLSEDDWLNLTQEQFDKLTAGTAMRRTSLEHIKSALRPKRN